MNIKTTIVAGAFSVLAIVASGFPGAMAATLSNHSGTICKNSNGNEATYIWYYPWSTFSTKSSATEVICPLVRRTTGSNGAIAYVDVEHYGVRTTKCTLYSFPKEGYPAIASVSKSWTGAGYKRITLNLQGAGKSNKWSDYSVLCSIPGGFNSELLGIDLEEY
jgi:hypothetical protein